MPTCMHARIHRQTLSTAYYSKTHTTAYNTIPLLPRVHRSQVPTTNHSAHSATNHTIQMLSWLN